MLLLLRAGVPNGEMLLATTERELALLCTKHKIEVYKIPTPICPFDAII
jgi:hypothetical protein